MNIWLMTKPIYTQWNSVSGKELPDTVTNITDQKWQTWTVKVN